MLQNVKDIKDLLFRSYRVQKKRIFMEKAGMLVR